MNQDDMTALNSGLLLKSSLEIYAPLDAAADPLENKAQSLSELQFETVIDGAGYQNSVIENQHLTLFPNPVSEKLVKFVRNTG